MNSAALSAEASDLQNGVLGPLPSDWSTSTIAQTCEKPEYGYTESAQRANVGPKFIRITDIQDGGVNWATVPHCRCEESVIRRLGLRPGDLLIARIGGTTGKSFLVRDCPEAVFASYLIRLRATAIDPEFLYFFCQSDLYWRQVLASKGEKLKGGISGSTLGRIVLPLPGLPEQLAIASVLLKLQAAVKVQDRIVATIKELRAATMAKLFREGLRGEPLKETEIGEVPESWEVAQLGGLFDLQQGKALSQRAQRGVSPRPFLRTSNVFWGRVDLTTVDSMDFDAQEAQRLSLTPGDLLVCEGGEIGRTAMWTLPGTAFSFQNHLHRLRSRSAEVFPEFFMYWMEVAFLQRRLYGGQGNRTTIPNLSASRLRGFSVPRPKRDEQLSIARVVSVIGDSLVSAERKLDLLRSGFSAMLEGLLSGSLRLLASAARQL